MSGRRESDPLIRGGEGAKAYGITSQDEESQQPQERSRGAGKHPLAFGGEMNSPAGNNKAKSEEGDKTGPQRYLYYVIYALV